MGYTHYWEISSTIESATFDRIVEDFRSIVPLTNVELAGTLGDGDAEIDRDMIAFNGKGDDSYESFVVLQLGNSPFEFCKTQKKPYDVAVMCCLIIVKHYLGDSVDISSDGGVEEWAPAVSICDKNLGYGGDFTT